MHDDPATFSIIIPTHNRAMLTLRAIDSALDNLPCGRVEVLVVDDASSDDTRDKLHGRCAGDRRVQLLALDAHRGPSAARNLGMARASGPFLLFLDSDDLLLPDALAFARAAFEQAPEMQFLALAGHAMLVHNGEQVDDIQRKWNPGWAQLRNWPARTLKVPAPAGGDAATATLELGDLSEAILFSDLFFLSGTVVRRAAAQAAGQFCERFCLLEDWDFMARVCRTGPGGYLEHAGFLREHGRADQLSAAASLMRRAVMHHRVLDTIGATGSAEDPSSRRALRRARACADYLLARALLDAHHAHWSRQRFARAMIGGHKPFKSLGWLLGALLAPDFMRTHLDREDMP